ncbi:hypothetical protein [Burkholderia seminalis]|uniref:hypothetical protein n=1 Tax=Burkholderia seminalis TaxID=488731 RepID=UPI000F59D87A|nr:hypothetical protein [Burkholderia seminalis]RQS88133.1 hypothetical protein DF048_27840 [Burkholderia seminalis]
MSKIVGVHGVGQQFEGAEILKGRWMPALKDGMSRANQRLASDDDFTCAFYGDLFRPTGKALNPPYNAESVDNEWEQDLLSLWWQEAARVEVQVSGPDAPSKVRVPSVVQRALNALTNAKFFADIAERALIFDLKQARCYMRDPEIRHAARARVEQVVGADTRVIIAHSLGSVVAYEALCAHPEWQVTDFITIGSPLGINNLIFHALIPAPEADVGIWPECVKRWTNIADEGDVVALVKNLSMRFGPRVTDRSICNGANAHDATRYLTTWEIGNAISKAF